MMLRQVRGHYPANVVDFVISIGDTKYVMLLCADAAMETTNIQSKGQPLQGISNWCTSTIISVLCCLNRFDYLTDQKMVSPDLAAAEAESITGSCCLIEFCV